MKKTLLLLLGKYRTYFVLGSGLSLVICIFYAYKYQSINFGDLLTLIISWAFFSSIIFNVSYVIAPSISEDSNIHDIISRWVLVLCSFVILVYGIINICFK
ncbi:hypothetical protein I6M70_10750 [Acinetobacter pittii]|uniref:hypothetical protein n=1 Tax=Acinetobacter pittii TaxID=48296 RepID=UPI0018FF928A|nr:hypothetical protein [Acinetobacter pittii]MBJ8479852.1 hypothetical protein [Acinetobacter pittii]MCU4342218.1 hypothetical protein [Acinetobacter pittii]MCU4561478.1 hypothetical protein [Acinetobacter pittii]